MDKHEKRVDQEVPLVIYKSGERIKIGHAILKGDGSIVAQVAKDVRKEIFDLFLNLGDISLNPKVPSTPDMKYHTSTYFDGRTQEPREVVVLPSLKIQEQ